MGEGWGEGKTTAPISDDPKTQGRLKSPANPNLVSGNRLKEYNGIEYTYDALGNLIYRQLPDGENQYYQYDLENQLVRAEIKKPAGNTEIWTYAYDPFGRRLSKERQDKLAWTSTEPKRTHFVWDGTRLLQEYTYKGSYTYIYTDQDSYEPLAQIFDNAKDGKQYIAYFHNDQIGIPREMTDIHGNLLWYGEYTAWGRLKKDERVYKNTHQPFRLQNQYYDEETGLHYNFFRYYEPDTGRFIIQDPIGLLGGYNLYQFAPNVQAWIDVWGLSTLSEVQQKVNFILEEHLPDIRKIDPNASIGYRGSVASGMSKAHDPKQTRAFNPRSFDVDAFIISDFLANDPKFSNRRRDANRINGMSEIESSIDKKLRSAFPNNDFKGEKFGFRIFKTHELEDLARKGDIQKHIGKCS